ncbi:hypothetical protein ACMHYK_01460 [Candidatus Enterenecus avicola]|uniref:hypothetical protein n=1 Tax=Enterococcus casseliflavus TaxID=37734 RepID=UPI001BD131EE|nr:hypothetical protein [Enterococcus casseliflavus]
MKKAVTFFVVLTFIVSQILTLLYFDNLPSGYQLIVLLPSIFVVGFFLFFFEFIGKCSNPFVLYGTSVMEWIRFIILPPICAIAGNQNGMVYINPTVSSLNLSIILMIVEYFAVCLFCKLMIKPVKPHRTQKNAYIIIGRKSIYVLFFAFSLIVYFFLGRGKGLIRFLIINVAQGERIGDTTETGSLIIRQLILCTMFLSFVLIVNYFWKRYQKTHKNIYVYGALIAAAINISIIVGERRTAQVYALLCSLWILINLFPKYRKKIIISLTAVAGFVLLFMSIYKFFGAFMFDSYEDAISNSEFDIPFLSRTLQIYFFGPENIAITLDFFKIKDLDIFQMFFDFLRSIFGFNYIFRGMNDITSVAFNTFIYGTEQKTGHLLSAAGYGFGFLGPFFIPFFSLINIYISLKLENLLYRLKSLELIYIVTYVLTRFVTNLFLNTPALLTQATMMAFTSLVVVGIAALLNRRNESIKPKKSPPPSQVSYRELSD